MRKPDKIETCIFDELCVALLCMIRHRVPHIRIFLMPIGSTQKKLFSVQIKTIWL